MFGFRTFAMFEQFINPNVRLLLSALTTDLNQTESPLDNTIAIDAKKMKEHFKELQSHELRYSIIIALRLHDTLNLEKLSKLLSKSKSTAISHLRELVVKKYIEIDQQATGNKAGKYYKLTTLTQNILDFIFSEFEIQKLKSDKKKYEKYETYTDDDWRKVLTKDIQSYNGKALTLLDIFKSSTIMNKNIVNISLDNFGDMIKVIEAGEPEKLKKFELPPGPVNMAMESIPLTDNKKAVKLMKMISDFEYELTKLAKEYREEIHTTDEKVKGSQYVYMITVPMEKNPMTEKRSDNNQQR